MYIYIHIYIYYIYIYIDFMPIDSHSPVLISPQELLERRAAQKRQEAEEARAKAQPVGERKPLAGTLR